MANNIQIVGDILNTEIVSRYSTQDAILIESQEIQENFGAPKDYIEYYVYDAGGNLLDLNYNYRDFKLPIDSSLSSIYTVAPNPKDNITNDDLGLLKAPSPVGSSYPVIEIDPIVLSRGEFSLRGAIYHELGHFAFGLEHESCQMMSTRILSEEEYKNNWDEMKKEYITLLREQNFETHLP
jgi:hypothetical protein